MTVVRVSPGDGFLCRQSSSVLFASSAEAGALVAALATQADPFDAVTNHLVDVGFDEVPFALIEWHDRVRVTVFGDLEVRTDHPALSLLSGASSSTWVEHTLPSGVDELTLTIGDQPVVAWSDLGLGMVPAGGLELSIGEVAEPLIRPEHDPAQAAPAGASQSQPVIVAAPIVDQVAPAFAEAPDPVAETQASGGSGPSAAAISPTPNDLDSSPPSALPPEHASFAKPAAESQLSEAPEEVVLPVDEGSGRVLTFDDGVVVELTDRMVIGRKPSVEGPNLVVGGDRISREHLALHCDDGKVFVTDLASTNGTYILLAGEAEPIRLPEDIPFLLDAGATVRFGSRSMTLEVTNE